MRCPFHRRFFLITRSSTDGSPVHSGISLFVTLSIPVILMIERRSLGSVYEGGQHDCTVCLAFNPHGHMVVVPESLA
ncbi:hypothetical protein NP493_7432g00006 [Ridgeia piscesae]|uniref:Uncharacterized protein n=1 Tax=Ridgeia piscesae TaxID=27915 RepID=A0AAD9IQP7_RIDPI|nr:hypothetical protein NP493_7432g00006 [Ridgeia piscesae]